MFLKAIGEVLKMKGLAIHALLFNLLMSTFVFDPQRVENRIKQT